MGRKRQRVVERGPREEREVDRNKGRDMRGKGEKEILKIPLCSKFMYFSTAIF